MNLRTDAPDSGERIALLIETGVKVASFAQAPRADIVARLRDAGIVVIPTVGARRHAEKVAEWGVHGVIAQGAEGGGHTGTVPTSLLLPQVVDAVGDTVPVIGAGGFSTAAASWPPSPTARPASPWGRASCSQPESTVPDDGEGDLPGHAGDRAPS